MMTLPPIALAPPIVTMTGLACGYPGAGIARPVLEDFSLAVAGGAFIAVVGASGVGKSTLLRVIAGLSPALAGRVDVAAAAEPGTRAVAMVFQEPRLLPWRRVLANVEFGLEGLGLARGERRARAEAALSLVGLAGHGGKFPRQLSGGQRQRVGLARALAVRPALLLMDEPFSALDAITRATLQDELLRIWHETGTSILLVTHDLEEAVTLADRVILLDGRPAHIKLDRAIDLPRPRPRDAAAFGASVRIIRDALATGFVGGDGI
ncbi:MAG: ABC transporter ATP-binding protein [Rhodospirillales bacterium]|nr:ABC transporter ATP-binding protein [Rhodospirillales bacterium]MDE2575574.1 ABC transporter ATP-binding protein [Rhodospirillales bacterium]